MLLPYAATALSLASVERPLGRDLAPLGDTSRGAFVFRDNVAGWEKLGSKLLALGQLRPAYDELVYVTQRADRRKFDHTELIDPLRGLLERHPVIDVFLFAHGNSFIYTIETHIPEHLRRKIRLVYNTGCNCADQGEYWLRLGADSYIGHPGRSASSYFCLYFIRRWVRGWSVEAAVDDSNRRAKTRIELMQRLSLGALPADLWSGSKADLTGDINLRVGDPL